MRWTIGAMATLLLVLLGGDAARAACPGDCDGGGAVTIDELITGVTIALGGQHAGACALLDGNGDGAASIDELIAAVTRALTGCPAGPVTGDTVAAHYAALLAAIYADAVDGAQGLQGAVAAFLAAPSDTTLTTARSAWRTARVAYLQTEVARFYDGPIDNDDTGVEPFVNAWPLDEAYIDYVAGEPSAGIINDPVRYPQITEGLLIELNEGEGETTISSGWHAIEFLLWGQDFYPDGPGRRPATDYVTDGRGTANADRRAAYLAAASSLLVRHLETVREAWGPEPHTYRAAFLASSAAEKLRRILTGLGTLSGGELTGERMATAYFTKDQEDEHSCFSDNTHVDFREDEQGIRNVFFGRYRTLIGPGIYDLVRAANRTVADRARDAIQAASEAIYAIPVPFDQAILGADDAPGRRAIRRAIDALNAQTEAIADCAAALGISISTTIP